MPSFCQIHNQPTHSPVLQFHHYGKQKQKKIQSAIKRKTIQLIFTDPFAAIVIKVPERGESLQRGSGVQLSVEQQEEEKRKTLTLAFESAAAGKGKRVFLGIAKESDRDQNLKDSIMCRPIFVAKK